jgi:uncharacterized protein YndB with AHSA1/START domain
LIQQSVTVEAPPAEVFAALTEAAILPRRFPSSAESDARPGGAYRYDFEFPNEPEKTHSLRGHYIDIEAGRRLSYDWHTPGAGETEVAFTLEPRGAGTVVTLVHSGFSAESEESRSLHDAGWRVFLDNLRSVLERGVDERAEKLGMATGTRIESRA